MDNKEYNRKMANKEYNRRYYEKHKEELIAKRKEYHAEYQRKNKDKLNDYLRKWRKARKERLVEAVRCKECRFYLRQENGIGVCGIHDYGTELNDFYSFGEQREGERE